MLIRDTDLKCSCGGKVIVIMPSYGDDNHIVCKGCGKRTANFDTVDEAKDAWLNLVSSTKDTQS